MRIQKIFEARNYTVLFLSFFIFALSAFGQNQAVPPDENTIRVNTDLIQTNVTVVDKSGHFVDGLQKDQFELRVDGKPMPVKFFDAVVSAKANENTPNGLKSQIISPNDSNPTLRERKVVFFIDDLHLSLDSLARTRSAINHFIDDEMMPRDKVLIVSASGQIGFLQQFTENKAVLRAALARLKFIPFTTRDTDQPRMPEFTALRILNGDKQVADFYVEEIFKGFNAKGSAKNFMNYNGALEMVKNRANEIVNSLVSVSETSLGSLENLIKVLNQTDGRKLVFFASDGFYLGSKNNSPVDNVRLQHVVDAASRSGSEIYTIDARGLFTLQADATGDRPFDPRGRFDNGNLSEVALSQEALFTLAEQTGGKFLKNQNYFDKWVDKTLDENANYYVLAWTPEKETQTDGKFRRVEVNVVGRSDLTVRLQRGFLSGADNIEAKGKGNKKENSNKNLTETVAPTTVIAATTAPQSSSKKPLPTKLSLKYLDVPDVGGVLTSSVQVETEGLDYSGKQAAIDVAGVVFNDQGKQVADFKTGLNIAQSNKEQSVIYNNRTPLPPGIYQVRVGAREAKSGNTGTATEWIEIPDLAKKQLTLGSLLLGIKSIKKSDKPEDVQIQFSVDNEFARPLQLNFMSFVYNAAKAENGETNLATKIEIFDAEGRVVVNSQMRSLSTKGQSDLTRIPLTGAIRQEQSAAGNYLLRVTVNDLIAKTETVSQTIFSIQ